MRLCRALPLTGEKILEGSGDSSWGSPSPGLLLSGCDSWLPWGETLYLMCCLCRCVLRRAVARAASVADDLSLGACCLLTAPQEGSTAVEDVSPAGEVLGRVVAA